MMDRTTFPIPTKRHIREVCAKNKAPAFMYIQMFTADGKSAGGSHGACGEVFARKAYAIMYSMHKERFESPKKRGK